MLLRATHFMSLRGIANGDAVAISRKGHRIIKPTQDTFVLAWRKRRKYTSIKNREFDGFLGFLAGSYEGAYFGVRNRARFCQNAEKAQIIGF